MKCPTSERQSAVVRLLRVIGVLALAFHVVPPQVGHAASCFDRDLFSWDKGVDYPRALASETLAPSSLILHGRRAAVGFTEAALKRALGPGHHVAETWSQRDAEQQCAYLRSIGLSNSNSMHYYILERVNGQRLSGWFGVYEWTVASVGTLRAFLHRPADSSNARVYLLHLQMNPVAIETVRLAKGSPLRVVRGGPPRVEWDVERNRVDIGDDP